MVSFENPTSDCVGVESRERGAGLVLPWRTLRPPPFPTPGGRGVHMWSVGAAPTPPLWRVNLPSA